MVGRVDGYLEVCTRLCLMEGRWLCIIVVVKAKAVEAELLRNNCGHWQHGSWYEKGVFQLRSVGLIAYAQSFLAALNPGRPTSA